MNQIYNTSLSWVLMGEYCFDSFSSIQYIDVVSHTCHEHGI